VEKREVGYYPRLQQGIHKSIIEVQSSSIDAARSLGQDPGPRDREAVTLQPQGLHQGHILPVEMIVVAGPITRVIPPDRMRLVGKHIPDGETFALIEGSALDLIRGCCSAPDEVMWKRHGCAPDVDSATIVPRRPKSKQPRRLHSRGGGPETPVLPRRTKPVNQQPTVLGVCLLQQG